MSKLLDNRGRQITLSHYVKSEYSGEMVPVSKEGFFVIGAGVNFGQVTRLSQVCEPYKVPRIRKK